MELVIPKLRMRRALEENQLPSSAIVGDGGASWRMKALKRAKEQAAREGQSLEEVVEEQWGSLGELAVSAASHTAAPSHAHLHATKSIRRGLIGEQQTIPYDQNVTGKREAESNKAKQVTVDESCRPPIERNTSRYVMDDRSIRRRKKEDDADMHLAQMIAQNKQYSMFGRADGEYDFDDGPRRKARKKGANDRELTEKTNFPRRILTQKERCKFCFENPNRPRHLLVAIANFTYLSLPHWQSVVHGHCCILTLQHESATRAVDNNVWDEIRNFKKCLIMMFAKQEKDVVFIETVTGLAQQRRHCLVDCIPLHRDIAKEAPLYFKKAIDEAEDEWSQHNSKKLIDTSEKGLRGSIPKDFPYFHVEFGLNKGYVHVIDDEEQFKSNFGLNIIRGMLEEDSYDPRKRDTVETQKQDVASFVQDWKSFDWTKQLD